MVRVLAACAALMTSMMMMSVTAMDTCMSYVVMMVRKPQIHGWMGRNGQPGNGKMAEGNSIVGLTIPGSTQMFRKSKQLYLMSLFTYYDTKNDTEPIIYLTRMSNFLLVSELTELALIQETS